jgi:short subunit dehydrogenase-like uncharacterized protein
VSARELDVVVLGATGVTGRRVAAHLHERSAETDSLRWAAAARDPAKAERMLGELGVRAPETIAADVGDPASLRSLAARAAVVLDLVGPYTRFGRPVIEACVQEGAHYVDLTGEIPFVRTIIHDFDGAAKEAGVKVVQVCGFESLPADLSIVLAAEEARRRWEEALAEVEVEVTVTPPPGLPRPSDGISGGTLQSLLAVAASDGAETIEDPALLIEDATAAAAVRATSPIGLAPRRGHDGAVIAPMAPAPFINPAVVHRTAALSDAEAGRAPTPFRYREGVAIAGAKATLPLRWSVAGGISATQVGLRAFARASPRTRTRLAGALGRITPGSGYGPAADRLEGWHWQLTVFARTPAGNEVRASVDADGHPGYLATARMLGEAGILLAHDGTPARSGCLTPALALGSASAPSFEHARVRFAVAP